MQEIPFTPTTNFAAIRFLVSGAEGSRLHARLGFPPQLSMTDINLSDIPPVSQTGCFEIPTFSTLSSFFLVPVNQLITMILCVVSGNDEDRILSRSRPQSFVISRTFVKKKITIRFQFSVECYQYIEPSTAPFSEDHIWTIDSSEFSTDGVISTLQPYRGSDLLFDQVKITRRIAEVGEGNIEVIAKSLFKRAHRTALWSYMCSLMFNKYFEVHSQRKAMKTLYDLLTRQCTQIGLLFELLFDRQAYLALRDFTLDNHPDSTLESSAFLDPRMDEDSVHFRKEYVSCFKDLVANEMFNPARLTEVAILLIAQMTKTGPTGIHVLMIIEFLMEIPETWQYVSESLLWTLLSMIWTAANALDLTPEIEEQYRNTFICAAKHGFYMTLEKKASSLKIHTVRSELGEAALKNERVVNMIHLIQSTDVLHPEECRKDFYSILHSSADCGQFALLLITESIYNVFVRPCLHFMLTVVGDVKSESGETFLEQYERHLEDMIHKICIDRVDTGKLRSHPPEVTDEAAYFEEHVSQTFTLISFLIQTELGSIPFISRVLSDLLKHCWDIPSDDLYASYVCSLIVTARHTLPKSNPKVWYELRQTLFDLSTPGRVSFDVARYAHHTYTTTDQQSQEEMPESVYSDRPRFAPRYPFWIAPDHPYSIQWIKYAPAPRRISLHVHYCEPGCEGPPKQLVKRKDDSKSKKSKPQPPTFPPNMFPTPPIPGLGGQSILGFMSMTEDSAHQIQVQAASDPDLMRVMQETLKFTAEFQDGPKPSLSPLTSLHNSMAGLSYTITEDENGTIFTNTKPSRGNEAHAPTFEMGEFTRRDGNVDEHVVMKSLRSLPHISTTPANVTCFETFCIRKLVPMNLSAEEERRKEIREVFSNHTSLHETAQTLLAFMEQQADVIRVAEELFTLRLKDRAMKTLTVNLSKAIEFRCADRSDLLDRNTKKRKFSFVLIFAATSITKFADFLKDTNTEEDVKERKSEVRARVTVLIEMVFDGIIPCEFLHELFMNVLDAMEDGWTNEAVVDTTVRLTTSFGSFLLKEDKPVIRKVNALLSRAEHTKSFPDALLKQTAQVLEIILNSSFPPFRPPPSLSRILNPLLYHPNAYEEDGQVHSYFTVPDNNPDVISFLSILAIAPSKPEFKTRNAKMAPLMMKPAVVTIMAQLLFDQAVTRTIFRMQFELHLQELTTLSMQCKTTPFNQVVADVAIGELISKKCGNNSDEWDGRKVSGEERKKRMVDAKAWCWYLCDLLNRAKLPPSHVRLLFDRLGDECTPRRPNDFTLEVLCYAVELIGEGMHSVMFEYLEPAAGRMEKIIRGGNVSPSVQAIVQYTLHRISEGSFNPSDSDNPSHFLPHTTVTPDNNTTEKEKTDREKKNEEEEKQKRDEVSKKKAQKKKDQEERIRMEAKKKKEEAEMKKKEEKKKEEERKKKEEEKKKKEEEKKKKEEERKKKEAEEKQREEERKKMEEAKQQAKNTPTPSESPLMLESAEKAKKKAEKKKRQKEEKLKRQAEEEERRKREQEEDKKKEEERKRIEAEEEAKKKEREEREELERAKRLEEMRLREEEEKKKEFEKREKKRRMKEEKQRKEKEEKEKKQKEEEERKKKEEEEKKKKEEEERKRKAEEEAEQRRRKEEEEKRRKEREEEKRRLEEEEKQRILEERKREEEKKKQEEREEAERQAALQQKLIEEAERQRVEREKREEEERAQREAARRAEIEEEIRKQIEEQLRAEYEAKWAAERKELEEKRKREERLKEKEREMLREKEKQEGVDGKERKKEGQEVKKTEPESKNDASPPKQPSKRLQTKWTPSSSTTTSPTTSPPTTKSTTKSSTKAFEWKPQDRTLSEKGGKANNEQLGGEIQKAGKGKKESEMTREEQLRLAEEELQREKRELEEKRRKRVQQLEEEADRVEAESKQKLDELERIKQEFEIQMAERRRQRRTTNN
ncbi:hypothetical protein BLNAU_17207 [Blattamonas nauphoetae]|uniref:Uncharacterized protein n=1 Tax=Blattamonas nauphoetae TaxID=2049346 RepID=A0ABQ9X9G0_9EUKA|nr:hypothetical protein BLNAU_17207 [Blattamonas nauphoetae]